MNNYETYYRACNFYNPIVVTVYTYWWWRYNTVHSACNDFRCTVTS